MSSTSGCAGSASAATRVRASERRPRPKPPVEGEPEANGLHNRLETRNGPVHVFRPSGYDPRSAGVVVYVHGFYTNVDQAWKDHKLAVQFAASGRNALFIACEAPAGNGEPTRWTDLEELVNAALTATRLQRPRGPLVAVGHSGAYRTIAGWLEDKHLSHITLIDGLYGHEGDFRAWLKRRPTNRMTLVVKGTEKWARPFVRSVRGAVRVAKIPTHFHQLSRRARHAKLLAIWSQYGHMELITEGRTIPVVLARGNLPAARGAKLVAAQRPRS